jgi:hypothetical protein
MSDWKKDINKILAPYLLPERRVYVVPYDVWQTVAGIYAESNPSPTGMEKSHPAFTAMRHPTNNYPVVEYAPYIFMELGV